jgi:hypothetical protein
MSIISTIKIKEEILNLLRNSDVIAKSVRGVTTDTETFNLTSTESYLELSVDPVKNIRSVVKNSVTLEYGKDYNTNLYGKDSSLAKRVNFTEDLISGDDVDITYDYTTTTDVKTGLPVGDRVYADLPQEFVTTSKYPRVGFEIDAIPGRPRDLQHKLTQKNVVFSFGVFAKGNNIDTLYESVDTVLFENRKALYYLNVLVYQGTSPKEPTPNTSNTVFQILWSYNAPLEFQKET